MKSEEFAALAKAVSDGPWCGEYVYYALRAGSRSVEGCDSEECREQEWSHPDQRAAKFITWCANNREWLESAARLKDALENPGAELQEHFATVVADTVTGKTNAPAVVAFISQAVCTILKELAK